MSSGHRDPQTSLLLSLVRTSTHILAPSQAPTGNKADLIESRQVEESAGQAFAKEINGIFAETSAKDHTGGINELFTRIGNLQGAFFFSLAD